MTGRERVKNIIAGRQPDRCGYWTGEPHERTWPIYLEHFGVSSREQVRTCLGDDLRWMSAEPCYKHPEGKRIFPDTAYEEKFDVPVFANAESITDLHAYEWPNPDYLDFSTLVERLRNTGDYYRAGGLWTCFFHIVAEMFGMEEYFVKMHTQPDLVDAVTGRVCDFYLEANRRCFEVVGDRMDAFFLGNDLGTQLDLLVSPEAFDRFILPYIRKFSQLAHDHGYQVLMHSCGSIHKIVDRLIDAGIDGLHPLQAKAVGMDAETLARDFKGRIAFIGGIDTQDLLVNGTPEDVRREVRRVKDLLGPNLVVGPSHECLLPNVPPENVRAMAEEARAG